LENVLCSTLNAQLSNEHLECGGLMPLFATRLDASPLERATAGRQASPTKSGVEPPHSKGQVEDLLYFNPTLCKIHAAKAAGAA
jgi:hypothetical protein